MLYLVINCFGYEDSSLTWSDLGLFSVFSVIIIYLLLSYYKRLMNVVSSTNLEKGKQLNSPIFYETKDVLLQPKTLRLNSLVEEKTVSIWNKLLIYVLILCAIFTPLYKLLGVDYFL